MSASPSPSSAPSASEPDLVAGETLASRKALHSVPPPNAAARTIGKRPRMSNFRRFLLAVTALCHVPFLVAFAEAARRLGAPDAWAWSGAAVAFVLGVWLFFGRAERIAHDAPRPFGETFFFEVPYFVHWSACVFCLVPSVVYLVFEPIVDAIRGAPIGPSAGFFMWTYAVGFVVCLYGVTIRRWFFVTRRIDVPIRGLDPRLDGYRIAHLSDLHIGALTPAWWGMRWVRRANAEQPDLVAVTGDLVTSGVAFHEDIADVVGALRGKDGVFCAMGNHDYFGDGEPLITLLRARGSKVLRNEGLVIERSGARLFIAAIDDTWTRRADVERALEAKPSDATTLVLAHDPDRFPQIAERGVDLVLAGHTHGGQIAVPFLARWINASRLAHRLTLGLYERGDAKLYVHPGLGTTGPPIRLGVAPAVVILTLRAA